MDTLTNKKIRLAERIESLGSAAVAFSAGVDSTFLTKICRDILGDRLLAVTVNGAFMPKRELEAAMRFCSENGIRQAVINIDALSLKEFRENPPDRCYHCKKRIFSEIKRTASEHRIDNILDGSNVDDLSDYRPGMKALEELGIISPLRDAGLTKSDIRELSRELGLAAADKPSFACLATRIPSGEEITLGKLAMAEAAEQKLFELGFRQFRVRIHDTVARIELLPEDFPLIIRKDTANEVDSYFKSLGFAYTALDLGGYKTGNMNPKQSKNAPDNV